MINEEEFEQLMDQSLKRLAKEMELKLLQEKFLKSDYLEKLSQIDFDEELEDDFIEDKKEGE